MGWGRSQGGCERRSKVIVKFRKKKFSGVWSVGGCKKIGGGGGVGRVRGGVRVDVNEELKN